MSEPNETITADAERWKDRSFYEAMERCEAAWRAGVSLAVSEAVSFCRVYQRPPPPWLDEAVTRIVEQRRTPAEARAYFSSMVHYTRWDAVRELRDRKDEFEKRDDLRASTWERIFEAVSEVLAGTAAKGDAETIRKSYQMVERDLREGSAAKYFVPHVTGLFK